jgi:hypothetical protein
MWSLITIYCLSCCVFGLAISSITPIWKHTRNIIVAVVVGMIRLAALKVDIHCLLHILVQIVHWIELRGHQRLSVLKKATLHGQCLCNNIINRTRCLKESYKTEKIRLLEAWKECEVYAKTHAICTGFCRNETESRRSLER